MRKFQCILYRIYTFFLRLKNRIRYSYENWRYEYYHFGKRRHDYELYGYLYEKRKSATGTYFAVLILEDGKIINCEMSREKLIECGIDDIWRDDLLKVSFHMDDNGWITMKDIRRVPNPEDLKESTKLWFRIDSNSFYVRCRFKGDYPTK